MKQISAKFLAFQGKNLLFLQKDGTYWITIKPVCEAIKVEYTRSFKNIHADPILGPALAVQPMQVPGAQLRNMTCLPEHLIYGRIFSIRSNSRELAEYKMACYFILFEHFHGTITVCRELLVQKAHNEKDRSKKEITLRLNPDFNPWEQLKAQEARIGKLLKEADRREIDEQIQLFDE